MEPVGNRPAIRSADSEYDPNDPEFQELAAAQAGRRAEFEAARAARRQETVDIAQEALGASVEGSSNGAAAGLNILGHGLITQSCGEVVGIACQPVVDLAARSVTDRSADSCRESVVPPVAESSVDFWGWIGSFLPGS